jgi:hypothetical protein
MRAMFVLLLAILMAVPAAAAPSLTSFELQPDVRGNHNTLIPNASKWIDVRVLAAGVAETVTVPADVKIITFSSTDNFYVNYTTTAAVPVADVTDGSGAELNPGVRYVYGQGTFSIISPTVCTVTMSSYK